MKFFRNVEKAKKAAAEVSKTVKYTHQYIKISINKHICQASSHQLHIESHQVGGAAKVWELDLSSLASVRKCANTLLQELTR